MFYLSCLLILVSSGGCLAALTSRPLLLIPAFLAGVAASLTAAPFNRSTLKGFSPPGTQVTGEIKLDQTRGKNSLLKTLFTAAVSFSLLGLFIGLPVSWLGKISLGETVLAVLCVGGSLLVHELAHYLILAGRCELSFHPAIARVGFLPFVYGFYFVLRNNRCTPVWNALSALAGPLANFVFAFFFAGREGSYFAVYAVNAALCCLELMPVGLVVPQAVPSDGEVFAYYLWKARQEKRAAGLNRLNHENKA